MSKNVNHIQHVKSNVVEEGQPKLPQSSVLVDGELAINYASGYETISIKNSDGTIKRFSSDDYYTEQKLGSGFTGVNSANTVTKVIKDNELVISSSLNDLDSRKLDASAYTPTDLSNYYTKDETSGKTEISNALGSKVNTATTVNGTNGLTGGGNLGSNVTISHVKAHAATGQTTPTSKQNAKFGQTVNIPIVKYDLYGHVTATTSTTITMPSSAASWNAVTSVTTSSTNGNISVNGSDVAVHGIGTAAYKDVSNGITNSDNLIESKHIYSGVGVTVAYDSSTHYIQLKSTSGNVLSSFDASSFLVDGMVDSVTLESKSGTTYLVIEWNTAAGKTKTELNIGDIFEADNYLTKAQLTATTDYTTVTKANSANTASTVALTGVTDADDLKAIEALTGTSGLLKKTAANTWSLDTTVYSSATQVNTALSGKSDTGHTHDDRYYTEAEIDTLVGSGFTSSSITDVIISDEKITSAALNDLNENKLDASAYTPTDLSDYYTKGETSGASQISTALNDKASNAAFTAHTASTVHMTTTEKTNLDSLATNIGAISGITSAKVTSWDNAVNDLSALTADVSGQSETVAAALNVLIGEIELSKDNLVSVTYSELVGLKASSALVPGTLYRITDYQCTTAQDDTSAATHNFDIIVTATDVNVLSENAKAIKHDGDTYFSASTLGAWELKYSLENDTDRFQWADDTNGKGVIWWMKDEWNNECWYDFKNIMFKRYKITASTVDGLIGLYSIGGATNITADTSTVYYCYTFTMIDTNNNMPHDVSVEQNVYYGDEGYCYKTKSNIFKPYYDANYDLDPIPYLMILPNNVFVTDTDICAIEGTYGEFYGFYDNTFGNDCGYNTFGNYCESNTFGNSCRYNTFGNSCRYNTFGNNNYNNTFGNSCRYNTFGNSCRYNTFGNGCGGNTFGNSCGGNTFGNNNYNNTFGNNCNQIKFQKDYIYYCIIENGNQYINITSTQTTSSSNVIRNFTVSQGVNNSTTVKPISHNTVNDTFKTTYQNSSSTVVNI